MKLRAEHANGLRVMSYMHGEGERLVLLLHGFPDDAASMLPLLQRLSSPEHTLVAPYLRGYGPTSRAPDGRYFPRDLALDALGLMDALGFERATIIGHDWGALAGYALANMAPERVDGLVAMSLPPPRVFLANLPRNPAQLLRSWYILLFQARGVSSWALRRRDLALIHTLWRLWSPDWKIPPARIAKVRNTFERHGTTRAALRYYRALIAGAVAEPEQWRASLELVTRPLRVPTMVVCGARDGCIGAGMFDGLERGFAPGTPWELLTLDRCGHFPQHEALDALTPQLLRFLTQTGPVNPSG